MNRRYDPRETDVQDSDPYAHLMDHIDALLQDDAYNGPNPDDVRQAVPDPDELWEQSPDELWERNTPPRENYYGAGREKRRQPGIYAYNADFERPAEKRRAPAKKQVQMPRQADRYAAPKKAPTRRKKRHPIRKLIISLLLLLAIACAALWIFAKQPIASDTLGARKDGCSTILLAGTDADGTRTDTMMLLYLDQKNGVMNLMSLPRDTYTEASWSVPKLNSVYGVNQGGEAGMEALLDSVKRCIGYRPDGYILVDLDCFAKLVDIMGGVTFCVPMDMEYSDPTQDLNISLQQGEQTLNGQESMWVVRFRSGYAMADLQRVQVQRDFMQAAMAQWSKPSKFLRYPAAASLLTSNTITNLSLRNLVWIAKAVLRAKANGMRMETLPGEAAMIQGGSYYVQWPETTANLVNEAFNPYQIPVTKDMIYSPWY